MHLKRMKRKKAASNVAYNPLHGNEATTTTAAHDPNAAASASFQFCGECSSSCAPPPPLSALHVASHEASTTSVDMDDISVEHASTFHAHVPSSSVRSRLGIVSGLCCPSEVPTIRNILKPLPGVHKLGVNVATKVVFVDHDPHRVTAADMKSALVAERFAVEILRDGSAGWNHGNDPLVNGTGRTGNKTANDHNLAPSRFVESTLLLKGVAQSSLGAKEVVEKLVRQKFLRSQVRAIHIHVPSRTLKVEHDPQSVSVERVKNVLMEGLAKEHKDLGDIEVLHDGGLEGLNLPELQSDELSREATKALSEEGGFFAGLKSSVVISGIFWIVSLLHAIDESLDYLKYAGIVSVLFGIPSVLIKACATIRRFQFDANSMMVVAAFGALALGEYDEAASVSFLFSISEWLESRATSKARRALGEIVSLRPDYANVVDGKSGRITIIPATNVPLGSVCSVRTGDKVPADGIVVEGRSLVDESSITGEARPVDKVAGSGVFAGSINVGTTQLVIKTTSTVGDSTVSRLIALVEEAQTNRSETEKLVDSFAKKYTPFVLATAFLVSTVPWIFGVETGRHWALNGLIIIVIACPCALTISTPVTYSAGLAATAKRGIIIKGGSRLEALGNSKTVIFDKTGTLTQGKFALNHLELICERKTRREILELLSIMEAPSSHPLSATLVAAAKAEGAIPPDDVSVREHTILNGEGVCAIVNNRQVYVGNERLFKRIGMYRLGPQHMESAMKWNKDGGTVGYIGVEGETLGIIAMYCVTDTVRDEAHHVVSALIDGGVRVVMLTGDGEGAALAVGEEIGLPNSSIQCQLLPEDKLHYVAAMKDCSSRRSVCFKNQKNVIVFVGDGVNDAASLAVADVGVAMGHGAALALDMSDVTLMDSNLTNLLFSMKMGTKVIATVKENIIFSLIANATAIGLTFAGKMTLLLAIVCDVGVMLLVTLNGMKLLSARTIKAIDASTITCASSGTETVHKNIQNGYEIHSTEEDMELV